MTSLIAITKRELAAYFGTPIAYVFLVIFVMLTGVFAFYIGQLFDRGIADMQPFFTYIPWLYLVLIPPLAMRLWAEERKSGTIELLMTLPVSVWEAVIGKWLAGTLFIAVSLIATFPLWVTVNILGNPDNGVIASSYLGAWVLAAIFLAIGATASAVTKNQVIAFVLAVSACFIFLTAGSRLVLDVVQGAGLTGLSDAIAALSAVQHFDDLMRGSIGLSAVIYAVSMLGFWLFANTLIVSLKKAD